ncbi:MAG: hypothetical protein AAF699_14915 [Pseudomonadota bacterium]
MTSPHASLPAFEYLVTQRDGKNALVAAISILDAIDQHYGSLSGVELGDSRVEQSAQDQVLQFCTRFSGALDRLVTDPQFDYEEASLERFLKRRSWIDIIFSLSGFRSSDYLLPRLATRSENGVTRFRGTGLLSALALMSLDTGLDIDFDKWWKANPAVAAVSFLNAIRSGYAFTPRAEAFRERLLAWLPQRLDDVQLGLRTLADIAGPYMHCSYSALAAKHAIKSPIMRQLRQASLAAGAVELDSNAQRHESVKPTIVVVFEWFKRDHSVYRTHSAGVRALRERFHVIGVGGRQQLDFPADEFFDEFIALPESGVFDGLKAITEDIVSRRPDICYFLGVGMSSQVVALASLRLAPIQCVSFGHAATTMSPTIDYMILPEDFVGDRDCYSEKVLALPKTGMPFTERALPVESVDRARARVTNSTIRVAIPASVMKLNAPFFGALRRIVEQSSTSIRFEFMPLLAAGLVHVELTRQVLQQVGPAIVHPHLAFEEYAAQLAACDLFLCPFPYGNMNSIMDCVSLGLPGVCLDGTEAHAHAGRAIFARVGLPDELSAQTTEDYVKAAVKLIDDADWRSRCSAFAFDCDMDQAFYEGDAGQLASELYSLISDVSATA